MHGLHSGRRGDNGEGDRLAHEGRGEVALRMQARNARCEPQFGERVGVVVVGDALFIPGEQCAVDGGRQPLLRTSLRFRDRLEPCISLLKTEL